MDTDQRNAVIKKVAVVVADVNGNNELAHITDPALLAKALQRCYDVMDSAARLYGGTMNPLTGEKLVSYLDLGDESTRLPEHAVDFAMEFRNRIEALSAGQEIPVSVCFRAGISSGDAILLASGKSGKNQSTLIGTPVDMAMRITDIAEPGQILADPEIFAITREIFNYHALEPIPMQGHKKPVPIFELAGKRRENKMVQGDSARMITSIMVGRSYESQILEDMIKQLLNGRGGVICLEGEAGIGKTRLVAEARAMDITGNVLFFEGRALSEGKNLSFHPIIQIIKAWSGITEEDHPITSYEKLSRNIIRIFPEQAQEIIPFIATMMGYPLEGDAKQRVKGIEGEALEKLILKNLRDLLARAAGIRPIILLVEDAHWADQTSISFLESLFKLVKNHRLLFINVFRPGYKETGEELKAFAREYLPEHHREIILGPLRAEESSELIDNLLKRINIPEDIKNLVISRSEGNPFFMEEVIRSFIDEGLIEIRDDRFEVTGQIQYANVPESIDKVILYRIERLDEKTKNLLKTASVIGRNFYYKVLEEATQAMQELDSRLEYLKEAQLLNESRHKEDVEFLFKHALAQQATYDSIIQNTRKNLHLKIAHSIEKVFAEKIHEFYGILALHYSKAEVPGKMQEYLVKAGDEAFRSGASSEALNYYTEALKSMPQEPQNEEEWHRYKELEIKIGFAQEAAGNNIEAIESFQRILTKYFGYHFPTGNFKLKVRALKSMVGIFVKLHLQSFYFRKIPDEDFNTFMRVVTQWGEAMTSLNPRQLFFQLIHFVNLLANYDLSRSLIGLSIFLEGGATMFMWTGISFRISKKMIDYAKKSGVENHPSSLIDYRFIRKMHDFHTGCLEEDRDLDDIFRTALHMGDFWPATIYCVYSGMISTELGQYQRVSDLIHKLEEISESFDNSHARAQSYRLSAWANYKFRRIDQTLAVAEEGIRTTGKTGHFAMLLVIWCAKSLAHSARHETDMADKAFAEATKLVAERKIMTVYHMPYLEARAEIAISALEMALANHDNVMEKAREALRAANDMLKSSKKMKSAEITAYLIKARVCCLLGKRKKAYGYFVRSIRSGIRYNAALELARAYFETGKCLLATGSGRSSLMGVSGNEYLLKARTLFNEMDLQWDLQRYSDYMER